MTTTIGSASDAYLAAVGAALAGVPDSDRQEFLDDLAEHLAELAHESNAGLAERLGSPEQYAAELLASAGIEPSFRTPTRWTPLAERARAARALLETQTGKKIQAFWIELRPGWWVLRGWLVLAALAARHGLQEAFWIPNVVGNKDAINVVLLIGAIVGSVAIGRRAAPKWLAWAATIVGVIALFGVLRADRSYYYRVNDGASVQFSGVMIDASGNQITQIFPYDAAGHPLTGVYLFNQDRIPLDVGDQEELRNAGAAVTSGQFPRPVFHYDPNTGASHVVQPPAPNIGSQIAATPSTPTKATKTTNADAATPTTAAATSSVP
jgi:hypothetical protein